MTPSEVKAACEAIWKNLPCQYFNYKTSWRRLGASLLAFRGKRYNFKRKSKYLGYGPKYLTTEGRDNMYAHRERIKECLKKSQFKSQSKSLASKGVRQSKSKGA